MIGLDTSGLRMRLATSVLRMHEGDVRSFVIEAVGSGVITLDAT